MFDLSHAKVKSLRDNLQLLVFLPDKFAEFIKALHEHSSVITQRGTSSGVLFLCFFQSGETMMMVLNLRVEVDEVLFRGSLRWKGRRR